MSNRTCTREQFLADVVKHKMTILRNDGLYRHIEFRGEHGYHHWFELVTWPNGLLIRGDMETWVFSRIEDMFDFFRGDGINPHYWREKLQCAREEAQEFNADAFRTEVLGRLNGWDLTPDQLKDVVSDLHDEVLEPLEDYANEYKAYELLYNFSSNGVSFDCEVPTGKVYSYHYIWCCYAIQWGIAQYDKGSESKASPTSQQSLTSGG